MSPLPTPQQKHGFDRIVHALFPRIFGALDDPHPPKPSTNTELGGAVFSAMVCTLDQKGEREFFPRRLTFVIDLVDRDECRVETAYRDSSSAIVGYSAIYDVDFDAMPGIVLAHDWGGKEILDPGYSLSAHHGHDPATCTKFLVRDLSRFVPVTDATWKASQFPDTELSRSRDSLIELCLELSIGDAQILRDLLDANGRTTPWWDANTDDPSELVSGLKAATFGQSVALRTYGPNHQAIADVIRAAGELSIDNDRALFSRQYCSDALRRKAWAAAQQHGRLSQVRRATSATEHAARRALARPEWMNLRIETVDFDGIGARFAADVALAGSVAGLVAPAVTKGLCAPARGTGLEAATTTAAA